MTMYMAVLNLSTCIHGIPPLTSQTCLLTSTENSNNTDIQICQIGTNFLHFLGHTTDIQGTHSLYNRAVVILDCSETTAGRQSRTFSGLVSFKQRSTPNQVSLKRP